MTIDDIRKASFEFEEPVSVLDEAEQVQLLKWHQSRWPGELDSLAGCTVGVAVGGANKLNSLLWCRNQYWFLNDIWDLA